MAEGGWGGLPAAVAFSGR